MAYSYNYLYIGVPTAAFNNDAIYIHSPNQPGFPCTSGTRLGSTTFTLTTAEGTNKSFYVYKFLASSYSPNFNTDSPSTSWLDSYNDYARTSYTGLQYSKYRVYKYCSAISSTSYSSLMSAMQSAGDSQTPPVYCFYTTVVDSSYGGSWEKWTTSTTSGTDKLAKRRNYTTGLIKDSSDIGIPSSNTYTRIIRLVSHSAYQTTVGVYGTGSVVANLNNSSYYKGYNLTDGEYDDQYMRITAGTSGEKYYALHSINSSACNLYAGMTGQGSATADTYVYYGSWGNGAWAHTSSFAPVMQSDGTFSTTTYKWCAAFTTRSASVWSYVELPLDKGYNYTFKLHTYSQASSEGIILRPDISSRPSTWSMAIGGTTSAYCTGADATQTYYLAVEGTDYTMYIYFYTDSDSYIGPTTTEYDSADRPIRTTDTDYSLGDVEVTRTPMTSTVTLNLNGGASGTTSTTATYGQAMPTIHAPRRAGVNGDYGFMGYWDTASGGTQYYKADGTSAKNWDKTSSSVTLYARWRNLLICDAFVRYGTYASGMLSKTDPSSSFNRLIIFTSDSPGISNVCGIATHSVYTKVSGTDSITLASGFRCTDGGTPTVSIWDGRYSGNAAFTIVSTGRGIVTNSHAMTAGSNIILDPPITFDSPVPVSTSISFPRVVAFSTPGGSNYLGATCNPGGGSVTFGSIWAFTIPMVIYKQTVSGITAAVSSNPINVNATTALTVTATYTNGATKKVLTSNTINYDTGCEVEMTQNPTGVISLTNY